MPYAAACFAFMCRLDLVRRDAASWPALAIDLLDSVCGPVDGLPAHAKIEFSFLNGNFTLLLLVISTTRFWKPSRMETII
jgi:hypothetical protein